MTRKKKVVIIIVSALVAVLMLGAVAFTVYRNVQIERLRVFIVDSLMERNEKSYDLSDRKTAYDSIDVLSVYWYDKKSYMSYYLLGEDEQLRNAMENDKMRDYYSYAEEPCYAAILHFDKIELSNGSGSQEGYYKCDIEFYNNKWNVYCDGPYINASECTPTEFVRRIL